MGPLIILRPALSGRSEQLEPRSAAARSSGPRSIATTPVLSRRLRSLAAAGPKPFAPHKWKRAFASADCQCSSCRTRAGIAAASAPRSEPRPMLSDDR